MRDRTTKSNAETNLATLLSDGPSAAALRNPVLASVLFTLVFPGLLFAS